MQLKIVSLNVWAGGTLWEPLLSFLREQDADIVLLQEVYHSQDPEITTKQHRSYTILSDELDYSYAHFAPAFIEKVNEHHIDQGAAVLSKLPLTPLPTVFFDVPYGERNNSQAGFPTTPRSLQHVVLELNTDDWQQTEPSDQLANTPHQKITNLHIFNTQGIWGTDGNDSERRFGMIDTILGEIAKVPEDEPVILAGDFNVREDTEAIAKIESSLQNVFKHELKSTFNMRRKDNPGYSNAVVDMIFTSANIRALSHTCPNVDISDHLPLISTIEI